MSSTPATERLSRSALSGAPGAGPAQRRVRHQAQDALAVMAFSGFLSVACAVALLLLTQLGR